MRPTWALSGALFALSFVHAGTASAAPIADETFSYGAGATVQGQAGGNGWVGGWITGQPTAFTSDVAIAGGPNIGATGGSMKFNTIDGRIFRRIDVSAGSPAALAGVVAAHNAMFFGTIDGIGKPGTTVWVGILLAGGDSASGHETQYHLYDGAKTDATSLALADQNKDGEVVAMLRGGNVGQWGFERTCTHSNCNGSAAGGYFSNVNFGGTHWSVTRYVFGGTTTEVTMWSDPMPGTTDPSDPSALTLTPFGGGTATQKTTVPAMFFDTIAVNGNNQGSFTVDEIRIGTTFADISGNGSSSTSASTGTGATSSGATSGSGSTTAMGSTGPDMPSPKTGTGAGSPGTGGAGGAGNGDSGSSGCGCNVGDARPSVAAGLAGLLILLAARRRSKSRT